MPARLIAKIESHLSLTAEERDGLLDLPLTRAAFAAGDDLVVEGEDAGACRLLLQGQAFRHRTLSDGRRQITAFLLAGDPLDAHHLFVSPDFSVTALTEGAVARAPRARLEALVERFPRLARAFWRMSLIEGAQQRSWMIGVGRRTAYARTAHLLCEIHLRSRELGLCREGVCRFPVTQQHLADALGLSVVHTNRVLQMLRADELMRLRGGDLAVLNWAGLKAAGEFDAAYLHLPGPNPV